MNEVTEKQKRANIRLALILGAVAIGFFFVGLYMSSSGS